ncbi:MAG: anti-sigma factor [Opitutales bacterium]|nr:anti-sigma factor [Opitutales bacterium]
MSKSPEDQMLAYLLGEMSEAERAAFENRMRKDPDLLAAVRELESALAVSVLDGLDEAPVAHAQWDRIDARLEEHTQGRGSVAAGLAVGKASKGVLQRYRWWLMPGAAAVFLLGVSIWLIAFGLSMERQMDSFRTAASREEVRPQAIDRESRALADTFAGVDEPGERMVVSDFSEWGVEDVPYLLARIQRMEDEIRSRDLVIASREDRISELEQVKSRMVDEHSHLAQSYRQLDRQFAELYEGGPGLARFTVIELVDARSFAGGENRRGLAEVARQFLMSSSGVLVGYPDEDVYYFGGEDTADPDWGAEAPMVASGFRTDQAPSIDDLGWEFETVSGDYARFESVSGMDTPLAFTVWSDDDQKGYLDVYNLPEIPNGQVAQLWLRGAGSDSYLSVGVLPSLDRGTGSLFYSVEEIEFTPREVLITVESGTGSNVPSGRVLLRGP